MSQKGCKVPSFQRHEQDHQQERCPGFVEAEDFTPAEAMNLFINFIESKVLKERAKQKKDE